MRALFLLVSLSLFSLPAFSYWQNTFGFVEQSACTVPSGGLYVNWIFNHSIDGFPDKGKCQNWIGTDDPCNGDGNWNNTTHSCDVVCDGGSLNPECSVTCPEQQYTYTLDGVPRSGSIGGGKVGHGQSCPQPSFPSGADSGCVGSPGTCTDFEGAIPENQPLFIEDTTKQETTNSDGSTTTTESKTSKSSGGGSSYQSPGSAGISGDDGITSNGNPIDPLNIDNDGAPSDLSDQQIEFGGEKYQLCNNGGIANSSGGCDYASNNCGAGQIDSVYGCVDIPQSVPPPDSPGSQSTTTNVGNSVDNGDGSSTTTTTTSTVTGQGTTDGEANEGEGDEEVPREGSAAYTCDAPPSCSGDAIDCAALIQEWNAVCGVLTTDLIVPTPTDTEILVDELEAELTLLLSDVEFEIRAAVGSTFSGGGSISPNEVSVFGVNIDFSFARWLAQLSIIGNIILAMAYLSALFIVLTGKG